MTYALGRGLEVHSTCRRSGAIVREAAPDYKLSSLIVGIVEQRAVLRCARRRPRPTVAASR